MKTKAFWLVSSCLIAISSVAQLVPSRTPLARRTAGALLKNPSQSLSPLSFVRNDISVGNHPISLTVGDFNGDANLDIAVLADTIVSIYLGGGTSQFTFKTNFSTGYPSTWIAAADLNGDGFADLVVANNSGRSVSVFLALGDGTFGARADIPLPGVIESVLLADLNQDGKIDIAASDIDLDAVSILLVKGDGTFGPNTEFPTVHSPVVVIADDFNSDSNRDLAVNSQAFRVSAVGSILLGYGDGTFQPEKEFATGFAFSGGLASGDLNGDGNPDLVVTDNVDNAVSVLLGNGDGTFASQPSIPLAENPTRAVIGDLNGDGIRDIAVAVTNSSNVTAFPGNGDGTFGPPAQFDTGASPQSLVAVDVNHDGKLDLITANYDAGSISILFNTTGAANPTPRAWLGAAALNNTLFTIGGGTCNGCAGFGGSEVPTVEAYDTISNAWFTKTSLESPRFGLTASPSNGIIYAIGGTFSYFSTPLNTVESYDPTLDTWSFKAGMPTGRWKLTSSTVGKVVYAIGGGNSGNQNVSTGTVEAYDAATDTWTTKASMPTARWGLASAAINANIYAVGGYTGIPSPTLFSVLEIYDTSADTWSTGTPMPTARMDLGFAAANGKLYAIGGYDLNHVTYQVVEEYDPSTDSWSTKAPMPTPRSGLVTLSINGNIYAFGGVNQFNQVLATLEIYNPASDTWSIAGGNPAISVSPNQIVFPPTLINTTSAPVTVTVSNPGTATLLISDISTQDPFKLQNFSSNIATGILPRTSGSFDVIFSPTGAGPYSGTVSIASNAPSSPTTIPLKGTVILPPPVVTAIFPTNGVLNQTIATFEVDGSNFDPSAAVLSFSSTDITTNSYSQRTANEIIASISISGTAAVGPRDVVVTNQDAQRGILPAAFNVGVSGFLSFPLKNRGPYDAKINTVFDHSMTKAYCPDNVVEAFTNEVGNNQKDLSHSFAFVICDKGKQKTPLYGFSNSNPTYTFSVNGQYTGTTYLYYDGHPGIDFRTNDQDPSGQIPVLAAYAGKVVCVFTTKIPCPDGPGEVKIDHGNGYLTIYLHLSTPEVTPKQQVQAQQEIGISGSTGAPGNPHLHFEVHKKLKGGQEIPVDPYGWWRGRGTDPYTRAVNVVLWK